MHRSIGIYLTAEEMGIPSLQMRSVESHSTSGREKEGNVKRKKDGVSLKKECSNISETVSLDP